MIGWGNDQPCCESISSSNVSSLAESASKGSFSGSLIGETEDCCFGSVMPAVWRVVVSGVTNSFCFSCDFFNGTYDMDISSLGGADTFLCDTQQYSFCCVWKGDNGLADSQFSIGYHTPSDVTTFDIVLRLGSGVFCTGDNNWRLQIDGRANCFLPRVLTKRVIQASCSFPDELTIFPAP